MCYLIFKVVGSIDQTGANDEIKPERNSESMSDSKTGVKALDSDKTKPKRKLYVGTQALDYRRDHMEVSLLLSLDVLLVAIFCMLIYK